MGSNKGRSYLYYTSLNFTIENDNLYDELDRFLRLLNALFHKDGLAKELKAANNEFKFLEILKEFIKKSIS